MIPSETAASRCCFLNECLGRCEAVGFKSCGSLDFKRPNRNQPTPAVTLSSGYLLFTALACLERLIVFFFLAVELSLSLHEEAAGNLPQRWLCGWCTLCTLRVCGWRQRAVGVCRATGSVRSVDGQGPAMTRGMRTRLVWAMGSGHLLCSVALDAA